MSTLKLLKNWSQINQIQQQQVQGSIAQRNRLSHVLGICFFVQVGHSIIVLEYVHDPEYTLQGNKKMCTCQ